MASIKGGDKLLEYLDRITRQVDAGDLVVQAGIMEDATYPDGSAVAPVAAV
jgi:hypothetical protein